MITHDVLTKNIDDIRAKLEEQETLLCYIYEQGDMPPSLKACSQHCHHKKKLIKTILETIEILEDSKKAFKSKQLESHRKRLTKLLSRLS
jgi:hypothetical protein